MPPRRKALFPEWNTEDDDEEAVSSKRSPLVFYRFVTRQNVIYTICIKPYTLLTHIIWCTNTPRPARDPRLGRDLARSFLVSRFV